MYFFVLGILALSHTIRYSGGKVATGAGVSKAACSARQQGVEFIGSFLEHRCLTAEPGPSSWGAVPWQCEGPRACCESFLVGEPKSRGSWQSGTLYSITGRARGSVGGRHHGTSPAHPEELLWLGTVLAALWRGELLGTHVPLIGMAETSSWSS